MSECEREREREREREKWERERGTERERERERGREREGGGRLRQRLGCTHQSAVSLDRCDARISTHLPPPLQLASLRAILVGRSHGHALPRRRPLPPAALVGAGRGPTPNPTPTPDPATLSGLGLDLRPGGRGSLPTTGHTTPRLLAIATAGEYSVKRSSLRSGVGHALSCYGISQVR